MNLVALAGAAFFLHAAPAQVLIYLGNEPSPTPRESENIRQIAAWLESSPEENDRILSLGILEDLKTFPEVVATDLAAIERHSTELSGVVVSQNRLLQSGVVLVGRGGPLERVPITIGTPKDGREASNPIANPANLIAVLELAAREFDPTTHEFVVVVESHGDEIYAVTPRLGLPTEGLTKETLFARVHGSDNAFVQRYGITTADLLSILAEQKRKHGFTTKLAVLASCESTIEALPPEVPNALVAAGGEPLLYGSVDFEKVLSSKEPTLDRAFISALTPAPFEIADPSVLPARRRNAAIKDVTSRLPYFLPLLAWAVGFVIYRRRQKTTAAAQ